MCARAIDLEPLLCGGIVSTGGVFVDAAASLKESRIDGAGVRMRQTGLSNRGPDEIEQLARGELGFSVGALFFECHCLANLLCFSQWKSGLTSAPRFPHA